MQRSDPSRPAPARARWATLVTRLVGCWVLAGALIKLLLGSPNDLPPVVRGFFLGPDLTFHLAITVELIVGSLALLQPRLGWKLLALQLAVFLAILVQLMTARAKSCGCFGSSISVPPWVMLAVDGAALAALLATRPWSALSAQKRRFALPAAAILAACVVPWIVLPDASPSAPVHDPGDAWELPSEIPRYVELDPQSWIGKPIADTQLARWMDVGKYNGNAPWILYRVTCDHCAEHLRQLSSGWASDPKLYVFVRLTEPNEEERRQIDAALEASLTDMGEVAVLPRSDYVINTPWEIVLEDGVVKSATFLRPDQAAR